MLLLDILKDAFKIYRNSFVITILGSISVISIILGIYMLIFPILFGVSQEYLMKSVIENPQVVQEIILTPQFQIKFNLFMLLIQCIIAPMSAGFYKAFDMKKRGEEVSYKVLFSYYNSTFTTRILGFVVGLMAVKLVIEFLLMKLGLATVNFSVSVILSLLFTLTIPIIIFENQSLKASMKQSSASVAPQMFTTLIVLFVGVVLAFSGVLLFGFGLALTLPIFYAINYSLYRHINQRINK
ncbi:hypothetical protein [Capnocytophaga stomatis]|uniref:Beta-carotene 15,15'-monooxygenase n=1 Tax=Capnocytophaga stomatis TaxID=1848904 RepID=A0A250FZR1_9FLAO|nr:hypothetical protein [Capnocytophaga stomatis]ATA89955.1 hypothetical protein CGC58_09605 [Capnocytophaga stomatis]GIJ94425.1 hypothetical protein CAPN002_16430 [Capnocytophaga stomatis]GIJ97580.1 hypothetical protein CAPN001_21490 [Capnocytophaga stomatis]